MDASSSRRCSIATRSGAPGTTPPVRSAKASSPSGPHHRRHRAHGSRRLRLAPRSRSTRRGRRRRGADGTGGSLLPDSGRLAVPERRPARADPRQARLPSAVTNSRALTHWLPVVLWAALIFTLSSIPHLGTDLGTWDLVLRKCAHMTEYAILAFLLARAIRSRSAGARRRRPLCDQRRGAPGLRRAAATPRRSTSRSTRSACCSGCSPGAASSSSMPRIQARCSTKK